MQEAVNRRVHEMNQRRMPDLYIYTTGMLDSALYVPLLKEALKDTVKYNPYAVKMALARNNVEPYVNQMLSINKISNSLFRKDKFDTNLIFYEYDIEAPNLFYLCSQESIKEYSKLLNLEFFRCIHDYDYDVCSVPARGVISLRNIILNENFRGNLTSLQIYDIKKENITWAQNWLEENYGNYELNRNFYPGLR